MTSTLPCLDCGLDTFGDPQTRASHEYYVVRDDVWAETSLGPKAGALCIGCLESRIGRKLTAEDFPLVPILAMAMCGSARLRNRTGWTDERVAEVMALAMGDVGVVIERKPE